MQHNKQQIRVCSWIIRTLYESRKLENVKQEIVKLEVNILGICVRQDGQAIMNTVMMTIECYMQVVRNTNESFPSY